MNYTIVDRQELLNYIDGSLPNNFKTTSGYELKIIILNLSLNQVCLVWQEGSYIESRPVWFVADEALLETIAFASTYIKNPKPFTGFTRILPASAVDFNWFDYEHLSKNKKPINYLSLVIAEAFLQVPKEFDSLDDISIQAGLGTLSSTILNAIYIGYTSAEIEKIIIKWKKTRALLSQDHTPYAVESVWNVWKIILTLDQPAIHRNYRSSSAISSLPTYVYNAILSIQNEGSVSYETWAGLCASHSELTEEYKNLSGVREEGIRSLQKITKLLVESKDFHFSDGENSIILGAALSLVSSGSLVFLPFSKFLVELFPEAPLWYAYFCSFFNRHDVMSIGNGLGIHLGKLLFKSSNIFDCPNSDIAFEELVMISSPDSPLKFRTENSSTIQVELYPLVNAKFRISRNVKSNQVAPTIINSESLVAVESLLYKALDVIRASKQINSQSDLFVSGNAPASSKPRSRKKQNEKF